MIENQLISYWNEFGWIIPATHPTFDLHKYYKMKITTTGSLGNVASLLVKRLIDAGHQLTVVSSKADRKRAIEALGATAAIGSISDSHFLASAFKGADSVYAMVPPSIGSENLIQNIAGAGEAYAAAIKATGVPRIVMLSSVGADVAAGTGPVQGTHRIEKIFEQLPGVNITVLRSGFFYYNFFRDIPLIKNRNIFGNNYSGEEPLALTHPIDIASEAARELQAEGNGFEIKYVVSDTSTGNKLAALFGPAIGKPELKWTMIPDDQLRQGMLAAGLPPELVGLIIELGQAVRSGLITRDFFSKGGKMVGQVKLADFVPEFKSRFDQA